MAQIYVVTVPGGQRLRRFYTISTRNSKNSFSNCQSYSETHHHIATFCPAQPCVPILNSPRTVPAISSRPSKPSVAQRLAKHGVTVSWLPLLGSPATQGRFHWAASVRFCNGRRSKKSSAASHEPLSAATLVLSTPWPRKSTSFLPFCFLGWLSSLTWICKPYKNSLTRLFKPAPAAVKGLWQILAMKKKLLRCAHMGWMSVWKWPRSRLKTQM